MTTAEKVLAVQTIFNSLVTTKYNGSVVVDSSLAAANTRLSVSASAAVNPNAPFSVEVSFIYNGLSTDAARPNDAPRFALMCSYGSIPSFGFDFAASKYYAGMGSPISGEPTLINSAAGAIPEGKVSKLVFRVVDSSHYAVIFNGAVVLTGAASPFLNAPNEYYLVFKGVKVTVLSTKVYYNSGTLITAAKGISAIATPYWTVNGAFLPDSSVIEIVNADTASEAKILLYLDAAASQMLSRMYPLDETKTPADIPSRYDMAQVELAARKLAREGAEGETSHNENGINRSYASPDDRDILSRLPTYCKVW